MYKMTTAGWTMAILLLLSPLGSVQASKLYKWVDESGQVHYTQHPPQQGRQATQIMIPRAVIPSPEQLPDEATPGDDPLEQLHAVRRHNCQIARQNLTVYQESDQIQRPDGTIITLDEESRATRIAETQAHIEEFCHEE